MAPDSLDLRSFLLALAHGRGVLGVGDWLSTGWMIDEGQKGHAAIAARRSGSGWSGLRYDGFRISHHGL